MARIYFTMQELESMKFRELPNMVYEKILQDLEKLFGFLTSKLLEVLNNAPVMELDQYVNIWKYIKVIQEGMNNDVIQRGIFAGWKNP